MLCTSPAVIQNHWSYFLELLLSYKRIITSPLIQSDLTELFFFHCRVLTKLQDVHCRLETDVNVSPPSVFFRIYLECTFISDSRPCECLCVGRPAKDPHKLRNKKRGSQTSIRFSLETDAFKLRKSNLKCIYIYTL